MAWLTWWKRVCQLRKPIDVQSRPDGERNSIVCQRFMFNIFWNPSCCVDASNRYRVILYVLRTYGTKHFTTGMELRFQIFIALTYYFIIRGVALSSTKSTILVHTSSSFAHVREGTPTISITPWNDRYPRASLVCPTGRYHSDPALFSAWSYRLKYKKVKEI